jgi:ABC-type dipeptide/oligopeptide/nickel transport system permease component
MGLLVLTVAVMLSNFAADVLYTYLDPRIRYD